MSAHPLFGLSQLVATVLMLGLAAASAANAAGWTPPWQRPQTLQAVEDDVARRHPDVVQRSADELEALRQTPGGLVLLDVREPAEYAVSHLAGAVRVDPDAGADGVLAAIGRIAPGAQLIAYCSVGERSSRLAGRTQAALRSHGAAGVANLRGGIFAWHNQRRALVNTQGPTDAIHGFDAKWSRLLQRRDAPIVIP